MVEEAALSAIESSDGCQIFITQFEIEDVDILGLALWAYRLGNRDDSALHLPAQHHLRRALAVLLSDVHKCFLCEHRVESFGERSPGHHLHPELLQGLLSSQLLMMRMNLDLVDRGHHLVEDREIGELIRREVAHTNRTGQLLFLQFLHHSPRSEWIVEWLVNQVSINVIGIESLEGSLERIARLVAVGIADPQLGYQKNVFSRHTAGLNRLTDRFFVAIGSGSINQAIAKLQRAGHGSLALCGIGNLKDPESELRHFESIVEGDGRDVWHIGSISVDVIVHPHNSDELGG